MPRLLYIATIPITVAFVRGPYARHFRRLGWRVDGMATGIAASEECRESFDQLFDVDWSRNPLDLRNLTSAARTVRRVVEEGNYDIVHVHTPVAGFATRFALRNMKRNPRPAIIYGAHGFHFYPGGPVLKNAVFLGLEKLAGRWADYLMVVNRTDEDAARRYHIVPEDRIRYVPGSGIDLSRYRPDAVPESDVARIREELKLASGDSLLLMLAEFNHGKRHRDALEGFARSGCASSHLAFAGVGPTRTSIERRSAELGLANRVHFIGVRHDIPALIRASAATILPSEREGLPRSIIESMSLGVPVIGSDIRGIRDLLGDGCGYLVPVGGADAVAEAIRRVISQPAEARARAASAQRRVAQYDIHNVLRLHEQFYAEILGGVSCTAAA